MLEIVAFTLLSGTIYFVANVIKPSHLGGWIRLGTHLVLCSVATGIVYIIVSFLK